MNNDTAILEAPSIETASTGAPATGAPATDASSSKLYVGSLPYNWTAENLEEMFKPFGRVTSAAVVADQLTRRSKGFGFVEFASGTDAQKAMSELNGREIEGRNLAVREARPHVDRANVDRNGGGGGGERSYGPRMTRERIPISTDNSEFTDTSGRSYGNRRGWW